MPTYDYECSLGHKFEVFEKSITNSTHYKECSECKMIANRVTTMPSCAGIIFKGRKDFSATAK